MEAYVVARQSQYRLFDLYHIWYAERDRPPRKRTDPRVLFKGYPRVAKTLRPFDDEVTIKQVLYKALRLAKLKTHKAWRRMMQAKRFHLFHVIFGRRTNIDISFTVVKAMQELYKEKYPTLVYKQVDVRQLVAQLHFASASDGQLLGQQIAGSQIAMVRIPRLCAIDDDDDESEAESSVLALDSGMV